MRLSAKLHRRGQMQMGEMVLVIVVAFIIGAGVLVFLMQRGASESTRLVAEQDDLMRAITAKQIATIPALRYSLAGREDLSVVDAERARQFSTLVREPAYRQVYRERYAGYRAAIEPVYPPVEAYTSLVPPEDPPFDSITLFDFTDVDAARRNSIPFRIPVLLFDPLTQRSSFAILTVTQVLP